VPLPVGAHPRRPPATAVCHVGRADADADGGGGRGGRSFPADATVTVFGHGVVRFADVRRGDVHAVVSAGGVASTSPLLRWSHADPIARGVVFVALTPTPGGGGGARTLRLTPGPLVPVGTSAALVPAATMAIGDTLYVAVGGP